MAQITLESSHAGEGVLARLTRRIAGLVEAWHRWRLYRRTVAALSALTPRELEDIGLSPAEIERAARDAVYRG
ncbi:MAG: DUF1127 domain-containing protein [Alphaproteobacteria bacterium]|nr:MAG: DUF1127 domain-containing protein [Alphaproteobacteria bacterium]